MLNISLPFSDRLILKGRSFSKWEQILSFNGSPENSLKKKIGCPEIFWAGHFFIVIFFILPSKFALLFLNKLCFVYLVLSLSCIMITLLQVALHIVNLWLISLAFYIYYDCPVRSLLESKTEHLFVEQLCYLQIKMIRLLTKMSIMIILLYRC